ncbi:MAG: sugar phosphate isomerase/epimerase [Balneolaceae bacterium]|nr:sugar phosphate isomerase/epimerase [Balneolaceae bacterium]
MKSKKEYSRKKFLKNLGVGSVSALFGSSYLLSACSSGEGDSAQMDQDVTQSDPLHTVSVQLYTFRNQLNEDIPGTLRRISDLGYKYVETYDFSEEMNYEEVGQMLRDAGLSVSSMHSQIPVGEVGERALRRAEAYGNDKVIWHGWPEDERYQTEDGTKELAEIYNEASEFLQSNGLQFGLHNHWWEMKVGDNGTYPFETLVNYISDDIFFEIDTYWVKTAGQDPADIIRKYGDRVEFLHIKDGDAEWSEDLGEGPHDPMVPVGQGTQNFEEIVQACGDSHTWMVVELDESEIDVFQAAGESIDYLIENNLAKAARKTA